MSSSISPSSYSYEDEREFRRLSWMWASASDRKDFDLLRSVVAPSNRLVYSRISEHMGDKTCTPDEWVEFLKTHLGDERLHTQHLLGAAVFELRSPDTAVATWQISATHLRDLASDEKGHWNAGCYVEHMYQRIDGKWFLAGIEPHLPLWEVGAPAEVFGDF